METDYTTDDHSSAVKTAMAFISPPWGSDVSTTSIGTLPPFLCQVDVPIILGKRHRDVPEVSNKRRR